MKKFHNIYIIDQLLCASKQGDNNDLAQLKLLHIDVDLEAESNLLSIDVAPLKTKKVLV